MMSQDSSSNYPSSFVKQQSDYCLERALAYYQHSLCSSARAQRYLSETRGMDWKWLKDTHGVGFGDRTLGLSFPAKGSHESESIRGALRRTGFLNEEGKEVFRGCITVPVLDEHDNILNVYGRKVAPYLRPDTQYHTCMRPPEAEFFNQRVLGRQDSINLCSSPFEALTLISYGVENVVSLCGMAQLTLHQIKHLVEVDIKSVEVAFANTCKGHAYAARVAHQLEEANISARKIQLVRGEDINSLHVKAVAFQQLCQSMV